MSKILRKTLEKVWKNNPLNRDSKKSDKILFAIVSILCEKLRKEYNIILYHSKSVELKDIVVNNSEYRKKYDSQIFTSSTTMKPDGGIVYFKHKGKMYPIGIFEDKKQGTNDKRLEEGKKKQSMGNAIERAGKNIRTSELLFTDAIFPYCIFARGCDLQPGTSIYRRMSQFNHGFSPIQMKHLDRIDIFKKIINTYHIIIPCTIITTPDTDWKNEEIEKVVEKILRISIEYYLEK